MVNNGDGIIGDGELIMYPDNARLSSTIIFQRDLFQHRWKRRMRVTRFNCRAFHEELLVP